MEECVTPATVTRGYPYVTANVNILSSRYSNSTRRSPPCQVPLRITRRHSDGRMASTRINHSVWPVSERTKRDSW